MKSRGGSPKPCKNGYKRKGNGHCIKPIQDNVYLYQGSLEVLEKGSKIQNPFLRCKRLIYDGRKLVQVLFTIDENASIQDEIVLKNDSLSHLVGPFYRFCKRRRE